MSANMEMQPMKGFALRCSRIFSLVVLLFVVFLFHWPAPGLAEQESPATNEQKPKGPEIAGQTQQAPEVVEQKPKLTEVAELKLKAQDAFLHGRYEEALAVNLKIARKFPGSKERHYAVQMLGTIYEDNLPDTKNALKWNQEFLKKYADSRQAPIYKEKLERLATIEKAANQKEAFKVYKKIKFANKGDQYLVTNYGKLLKDYPDFSLKVEIEKEIAYAYERMHKPKESYETLQAIAAQTPGHKLSSTDQITAEANHSYWKMSTTWKWVALAVVAVLWGAVLMMKPWKRFDRATARTLLIWTVAWVLLMASRMPTFYSMEVEGYLFVIRDKAIYTMAALNLPVILWVILLTRGEIWLTRPKTKLWVSPLLTMVMTVAVIYLFIAFQPNGPEIVSVFGVKYDYLIGEFRKGM
jgi:ribosomal protein L18E